MPVRLAGATGHALFWGGYEDAERGIYLFYPDYMDAESAKLSAPLALLRARKRREDTLTHRDYLGSLMGLQIDRSVVGDILVHEEGADIIVLEDMAEFILMHFAKAGRKQLSLTREDLSDLKHAAVEENGDRFGGVAQTGQCSRSDFWSAAQGRTGADREGTGVRKQHTLHEVGAPDYGRRPSDCARRRPCARGGVRRYEPERTNFPRICPKCVNIGRMCPAKPVVKRVCLCYTLGNTKSIKACGAFTESFVS